MHIEEEVVFYSVTPATKAPAKKEKSSSEESSSDEEGKPVAKVTGDKTKGKRRKSIFEAVLMFRFLSLKATSYEI